MKKIIAIVVSVMAACWVAEAQGGGVEFSRDFHLFDFSLNTKYLEVGVTAGQAGSFTDRARFGMGASVMVAGVYVDFIHAQPQHKYSPLDGEVRWNDTNVFCINAGYMIPITGWLRLIPLVGYAQTSEGITDGASYEYNADDSHSWYHRYTVTPGSRLHYFNYGGGISIHPCKWFSINAFATNKALYGGLVLNIMAIARN